MSNEAAIIQSVVAVVSLIGFIVVLGIWLTEDVPMPPEPWDSETAAATNDPAASPVCHRCFTAQTPDAWFCPRCGSATGPYNNWLPWVSEFSKGEMLRAGTTDHLRPGFLTLTGYLLVSLFLYHVFAPVFWFFLFRNLFRRRAEPVPKFEPPS